MYVNIMTIPESEEKRQKIITIDERISQLEVLSNYQRAQIFFNILQNKKATTDDLIELMQIQRSTLSYHLTKMVNAGILEVSLPPTGRMKKTYSLPEEERMGILMNPNVIFEKNDVTFIKKYFNLKTLEHQFNTTLISIFNELIQNGKLKIISLNDEELKLEVNGKTGFLPGIWLGDLTESQALYVEKQISKLIYNAMDKFPELEKDKREARYSLLLSQFPLFF